jgi:hypothetical protein
MELAPAFRKHIEYLDTYTLSNSSDSIYIVNTDFHIVGYNQAYLQFATENGLSEIGSLFGIGARVLDVVPEVLNEHYEKLWSSALNSNTVYTYDYECSSPDKYRKYHQTAYPIRNSVGLIFTNHCMIEKRREDQEHTFDKHFLNADNYVEQCSNCRKVKDQSADYKWDWVPGLVANPYTNTNHTLCDYCLESYYPDINQAEWPQELNIKFIP